MNIVSRGVQTLSLGLLSFRAALVISGVAVSNVCFVWAALELYKLALLLMKNEKLAFRSALMFVITPASIFMSAPYTESLFALCVFAGIRRLALGKDWTGCILFMLGTSCRSNGILLCGFVLFYGVGPHVWTDSIGAALRLPRHSSLHGLSSAMRSFVRGVAQAWQGVRVLSVLGIVARCLVVAAPFIAFQYYAAAIYCYHPSLSASISSNPSSSPPLFYSVFSPILSVSSPLGDGSFIPRPWCKSAFPNLYAFVQREYWNQGFFHYYESKQIPNFLLAAPMIVLSVCGIVDYLKHFYQANKKKHPGSTQTITGSGYHHGSVLPCALYWLALVVFSTTYMHVQVITRFFTHIPTVHFYAAYLLQSSSASSKEKARSGVRDTGRLVLTYYLLYIVLGALLFTTFYPWT